MGGTLGLPQGREQLGFAILGRGIDVDRPSEFRHCGKEREGVHGEVPLGVAVDLL